MSFITYIREDQYTKKFESLLFALKGSLAYELISRYSFGKQVVYINNKYN